ncbi:MAG: glutamine amidotransferase [Myxococcota bacterium]
MTVLAARFELGAGWVWATLLGLALVGAVVLTARELRQASGIARERRLALLALRSVTALLTFLVATQPRWLERRVEEIEGRLAVLVDDSRSLRVADGERSRADAARALVERWQERGTPGVAAFRFGSELRAASLGEIAAGVPARDDETRIVHALRELATGEGSEDLGAIVLVTDGAESDRAAPVLETAGVKVHAVALGGDVPLVDDAIAELEADPVAFLRQEAEVRVVVRALRATGGAAQIPVTLWEGEQVVREALVDVPAGGEAEVTIPFSPRRLGRAVYRVTIPVPSDDAVPANNERAFLVRVTRDKLRVLLVAGRPSWDVRFLRAFLKRDPGTDLISFFILRTTSDLTLAAPDELALIPFPTDELFREHLGSFDVLLFQNFDYGPYQMAAYLPRIREYVERGGAFAMIGGERSFGSGGYAGTPVADVLPVSLPRAEASEATLVREGSFRPVVEPELVRHPLVALRREPAASFAAWARLAPLEGTNRFEGLREGARVLLARPGRRGKREPLLVTGRFGEGRVLCFATDTSWRWGLTTGGLQGDASAFERFWDRAVRWLARDPALEPTRLTTDRERYGPEGRVRVVGTVADARYRPIAGEAVRVRLLDATGTELGARTVQTDREGGLEAALEGPAEPGAYRVVVERPGEEGDALGEEGFVVELGGDELADPRPRPERLRALAEGTGGRFVARAEDAPSLDAFDATRSRVQGVRERAPFASPFAVGWLVALLIVEWALRRRWGRR